MKKIISVVTISALSLSILASCGSSDNGASTGEGTEATETSDEPIELVVWESLEGPDEFIREAGEAYTELHPNVTIKFQNVEIGDTSSQIALDGPAGVGPDIFVAPHDKLGELVAGGYILPTADPEEIESEVLPSCASAITYDGTMYGYPVSAETYALFYNKDLIAEEDVPTTWEDLAAFSSEFNAENEGKYGFAMSVADAYYTILFTTSNDNLLFGPDGTDTTTTNINSQDSISGMEFFQSLRESALDVPSADLTTAVCDAAFTDGNIALYISGPWNAKPFSDAGIDFGVTTIPSLPGNDTPAATFSGTRTMQVSAYTDYPEEAADFCKFLLTDEMQELRFEITGALPATPIEVESEYANGFVEQLEYAFPMPSIPQMGAYWDAMNAASANIWDGADVKTELDNCNSAILQAVSE